MESANLQNDSDTDQDLLIKEACHDSAAFAQLYRLHYDNIFRYCARRLFNRHAAEDVTSIVFFKAMRTIGFFRGNSKDFRNWLYRIATNAVNDHLRTAKRRADAICDIAMVQGRDGTFDAESDAEISRGGSSCQTGTTDIEAKTTDGHHVTVLRKTETDRNCRDLGSKPSYDSQPAFASTQ